MKQKLSICAAIIHRPNILLLDEPFSGLDPFSCNQLIKLLHSHLPGRIHIIASHDLTLIAKVATHIAIIDDSRFVYFDSLENFTRKGRNEIETSLFEILKPKEFNTESINFIL
jgi:ABC-type multidrug transport system, ATPase component